MFVFVKHLSIVGESKRKTEQNESKECSFIIISFKVRAGDFEIIKIDFVVRLDWYKKPNRNENTLNQDIIIILKNSSIKNYKKY